jgi:hypothetical protein
MTRANCRLAILCFLALSGRAYGGLPESSCDGPFQIIFIIAGDEGTSTDHFATQKDRIRQCVCGVDGSGTDPRIPTDGSIAIGVIQFNDTGQLARREIDLTVIRHDNVTRVCEDIDGIQRFSPLDGGNWENAFLEADAMFFPEPGGSSACGRQIILQADIGPRYPVNHPTGENYACVAARNLRSKGVTICTHDLDEDDGATDYADFFKTIANTPDAFLYDPTQPVGMYTTGTQLSSHDWCAGCLCPMINHHAADLNEDCVPDVCQSETWTFEPDETGICCNQDSGACMPDALADCKGQERYIFQGPNSYCGYCDDNLMSCYVDNDCYACDGGTRVDEKCGFAACPGGNCVGTACVGGINDGGPCDCPEATCKVVGSCNPVSPGCTLYACCEDATGDCAIGFCDQDPAKPCNDYEESADCAPGETCVQVDPMGGFACPNDWTGLGYGTDCDPNICMVPGPDTAGDSCDSVVVHAIHVPPHAPDLDPVTVRIQGNTGSATYGDDPTSCGLFPAETGELGWWEGFSIDACASVRIDFCGSEGNEPVAPVWANLVQGCPCGKVIQPVGTDTPVGDGRASPGLGRGAPFCDDDNIWMTFGLLSPGDYYYPVYTVPGGSTGVPPGRDYQIQVTVLGCPEAACCLGDADFRCAKSDGSDWLDVGEQASCNPSIDCQPAGLDPGYCDIIANLDDEFRCDRGYYEHQLCNPNVECSAGKECIACAKLNELDCAREGGYWLAGPNLPDGQEPIVTCEDRPCREGVCCMDNDPGKCQDEAP